MIWTAIIVLIVLLVNRFNRENTKHAERSHYIKLNAEDARILYQTLTDDLRFAKSQQWNITNYVLLLLGAIVGIALIPTAAISWQISYVLLVTISLILFNIGTISLVSNYWRQRENRIGIYKLLYLNNEGKVVSPFRASCYFMDRHQFKARRQRDFSYKLDAYTKLFILAIAVGEVICVSILSVHYDP